MDSVQVIQTKEFGVVSPHSERRRVHGAMASRHTVGKMLPDPKAR